MPRRGGEALSVLAAELLPRLAITAANLLAVIVGFADRVNLGQIGRWGVAVVLTVDRQVEFGKNVLRRAQGTVPDLGGGVCGGYCRTWSGGVCGLMLKCWDFCALWSLVENDDF